eukprot:4365242-Pleurochrysis_carterae.AAC.1
MKVACRNMPNHLKQSARFALHNLSQSARSSRTRFIATANLRTITAFADVDETCHATIYLGSILRQRHHSWLSLRKPSTQAKILRQREEEVLQPDGVVPSQSSVLPRQSCACSVRILERNLFAPALVPLQPSAVSRRVAHRLHAHAWSRPPVRAWHLARPNMRTGNRLHRGQVSPQMIRSYQMEGERARHGYPEIE